MNKLISVLCTLVLVAGLAVAASAEHRTDIPDGVTPAVPGEDLGLPCDIQLRYDDGSDDTQGSGPTLGWYSPSDHQYLGVRFTPPPAAAHEVQSATWFSDFWVEPGDVEVHAFQFDNPANTTSAVVNVAGGGTWGVEFSPTICIPAGKEYVVMICPTLAGGWGVIGEDTSPSTGRSYWTSGPCSPVNPHPSNFMLWSCVTPCTPTAVETSTWGLIKGLYR